MTDHEKQIESVPFTEELSIGGEAEKLPDGNYAATLSRIEQRKGTRWGSEEAQSKAVFCFTVLSGEYQGREAWVFCNLPDVGPGGRRMRLSPKSKLHELATALRGGKPLAEGESLNPSAFIGIQGFISVSGSKVRFMRMDLPPAAPQDAYAEPINKAETQAANLEAATEAKETF